MAVDRMKIPDVMKTAAVDHFGPPSAIKVHEQPVPKPGPGEVLIRLDTAGVGSWDPAIRDGSWRPPGRTKFPLVLGTDGAGVVVAKGAHVRRFASVTTFTPTNSEIPRAAFTPSTQWRKSST